MTWHIYLKLFADIIRWFIKPLKFLKKIAGDPSEARESIIIINEMVKLVQGVFVFISLSESECIKNAINNHMRFQLIEILTVLRRPVLEKSA